MVAGEFGFEEVEAVEAAGGEDERVGMRSELPGEFDAEPGGRARDEGCATVEEFHRREYDCA
jgi:hypothetical protein